MSSSELSQLEAAACALIDSLPAEFRDSFKVFDAGFYLHHPRYDGGVPQVFEKLKAKAALQSKYYLLIGRQFFGSNNSKVWVSIELPIFETGCITQEKINGLENELKIILNEEYILFNWPDKTVGALKIMSKFIENIQKCCDFNRNKVLNSLVLDPSLLTVNLCIDNSCEPDPPNSVALITYYPTMPEISFKLNYLGEDLCISLKAELRITYKRGTVVPSRDRRDSIQLFLNEIQTGFNYVFDFEGQIHGGRVDLIIRDEEDNVLKVFPFSIKGENPTAKMVYDYIDQTNYSNRYWFFKRIATHENGAKPKTLNSKLWQFNEYLSTKENLHEDWEASSRCPNLSTNKDGGWGLTQLTNPKPRKEALWNWKTNIDDAYQMLNEKRAIALSRINTMLNSIDFWYGIFPDDKVELPVYQDGEKLWVGCMNEAYKGNSRLEAYFTHEKQDGEESILDAMIIKLYNGNGTEGKYYLELLTGSGKPVWKVHNGATYGGHVNYYVRSIANTKIPLN